MKSKPAARVEAGEARSRSFPKEGMELPFTRGVPQSLAAGDEVRHGSRSGDRRCTSKLRQLRPTLASSGGTGSARRAVGLRCARRFPAGASTRRAAPASAADPAFADRRRSVLMRGVTRLGADSGWLTVRGRLIDSKSRKTTSFQEVGGSGERKGMQSSPRLAAHPEPALEVAAALELHLRFTPIVGVLLPESGSPSRCGTRLASEIVHRNASPDGIRDR